MSEREIFEEWIKKEHPHIYSESLKGDEGSVRFKMDVDFMFSAWRASANRDGYKLVPVEPSHKQLNALKNSCALFQTVGVSDIESYGAYKAMIGEETK